MRVNASFKRLKKERQGIEKRTRKAYYRDEDVSGRDLARLVKVSGRIVKDNLHSTEYEDEDYEY